MESNAIKTSSSNDTPQSSEAFSGYQWKHYDSEGSMRSRAQLLLASADWDALLQYAARKRNGTSCRLLGDIGLGWNHMARIIQFDDGVRWIARLQMPSLDTSDVSENSDESVETHEICEYSTMSLVRQKTDLLIPEVHGVEARWNCDVKAPFILMDCLPGNVSTDLQVPVPLEYEQKFIRQLAQMHVQLFAVRLPMIGTIVSRNEDGTYRQGPVRGIGGPFKTATEFFEAWAAAYATFPATDERLKSLSGEYFDDVKASVLSFPKSISNLASRISLHDHGPFPLYHGDFAPHNVVVDDEYRFLGLIDWENSFAAPWEIGADFPAHLGITPKAIDAPWCYNEQGEPVDDDTKQKIADDENYIAAVEEVEDRMGVGHSLSDTMKDRKRQSLIRTMNLYTIGKAALYSKMIDEFTDV